MKRGFVRSVVSWAVVATLGCSAGAGGCGGCAEPIPGGFPPELRVNNAVSAKVSKDGLAFFESRVADIIGALAGQGLEFQVPCTDVSQHLYYEVLGYPVVDTEIPIFACDHSTNWSCGDENAGTSVPPQRDPTAPTSPPKRQCQAAAVVKNLEINPTQASPSSPVDVEVKLALRVNTGAIPVAADLPICGTTRCEIEYDSNGSGSPDVPINVVLHLKLDPTYGDVLAFDVGNIDLDQIVDTADLKLSSTGSSVCDLACDLLDVDFVKDLLFGFLRGMLDTEVRNIIDGFRCRACTTDRDCPGTSTCDGDMGVCFEGNPDNRVCPPTLIGLEGRVKAGDMLAGFGGSTASLLDLYAVAGGRNPDTSPSVKAENGGIVIGLMGGTRAAVRDNQGSVVAPGVAACVPARTFDRRPQPRPVNFDLEAQNATPSAGGSVGNYELGLALSDNFLDQAMFDVYQSGLLCLNVDSSVSTFLSSSLFSTFLPSLGVLTGGRDVPMLIALRPKTAPEVIIGKGTTKEVNGELVPDDPLLTIAMKQLQLDFYALIDDRFARLFSLRTDLNLPLSLEFGVNNTVTPVLADLQSLVTNINAQNSEMLAENPQIVADLLDAIIGLVQPVLAGVLAPIELPSFSGFQLNIRDALGVLPYSSQAGHEHLALFADLKLAGMPYSATTDTQVSLVEKFVPERQALLTGARPRAVVDVVAQGLTPNDFRGWEYSYRVDGGLWSPWTRRTRIEVASPVLLLQGRHLVEVRSRQIGVKETEDLTPAGVVVEVDYEAPVVALRVDADRRVVVTEASDAVSRQDELRYSYRVSGGAWSSFGEAREFALDELGFNPSLEVEVVDAAGRKARTYFGEPGDQVGAPVTSSEAAGGCASVGTSLLALGALAFLRRRRRA